MKIQEERRRKKEERRERHPPVRKKERKKEDKLKLEKQVAFSLSGRWREEYDLALTTPVLLLLSSMKTKKKLKRSFVLNLLASLHHDTEREGRRHRKRERKKN